LSCTEKLCFSRESAQSVILSQGASIVFSSFWDRP
jgi:hypothetical protein